MRKAIIWLVVLIMSFTLAGCQGSWQKALPVITDIIIKVIDAEQQLGAIEQEAVAYFKESPNSEAEAKVQAFLGRVKASLQIALRTAEALRSTGEGSTEQAFKELQEAWTALIGLLTEIGVVDDQGALTAGPQKGLQVAQPMALTGG
jgi:hypothetical protein